MAAPQDELPKLLEQATPPSSPAEPKGGTPRRTPGEQLVADIFVTKRITTRLHARLLERSLESFGAPACVTVYRELAELHAALGALTKTIDVRLSATGGGINATAAT